MARVTLDPGQLTARLMLQQANEVSDGQGGVTRSWTDEGELWAAIRPLNLHHGEVAGAQRATALFDIWLMMRSDISVGMRLKKGARYFVILSLRDADADEAGRFLILRCEEVAQ